MCWNVGEDGNERMEALNFEELDIIFWCLSMSFSEVQFPHRDQATDPLLWSSDHFSRDWVPLLLPSSEPLFPGRSDSALFSDECQ